MQVPDRINRVLKHLNAAGFNGYVVGGAVRDYVLGREPEDYDLTTNALPGEIKEVFREYTTVDVGADHGTIGVLFEDEMVEITTFRSDVDTDGRHATVKFAVSLEEDLARRDFTMNAMAWDNKNMVLIDPFGGAAALKAGVLRTVGDPRTRFREDYLRVIRALRFAATLDLVLEPQINDAINECMPQVNHVSTERVYGEMLKAFKTPMGASMFAHLMFMSGAFGLSHFHPLFKSCATNTNLPFVARYLNEISPQAFFALMLSPAKNPTHAATAMRVIKAPNAMQYAVSNLVAAQRDLVPITLLEARRFAARHHSVVRSDLLEDLYVILGLYNTDRHREAIKLISAVVQSGVPLRVSELPVDGNDMRAMGLEGSAIGDALRRALELTIEHPVLYADHNVLMSALELGL